MKEARAARGQDLEAKPQGTHEESASMIVMFTLSCLSKRRRPSGWGVGVGAGKDARALGGPLDWGLAFGLTSGCGMLVQRPHALGGR